MEKGCPPINFDGLLICCRESIRDLYRADPALVPKDGQELQCNASDGTNHRMIFRSGVWEWYREYTGTSP